MKTINAIWEKRNVGIECFEIEIGKNDTVEEVLSVIHSRSDKYFVAKVIVGRTDILLALQTEGFQFIETNIQTEIDLVDKPVPPSICANLVKNAGYHIGNTDEVEHAINEIREGHIFATDKVALDPYFSQKIAGQRYSYWSQDVMKSDKAKMIITEYNGENVGFNIIIDKGRYYDGFLGGLYTEYLNSGLGFANVNAAVNAIFDLGGKKMISGVSSNNFQMLKLHMMFGLKIKKMTYNLIKHV